MDDLILNYTERCNSHCTTCAIWQIKEPKQLPLDIIEEIMESRCLQGLKRFYLTGGEPFLDDTCLEIARLLKKHLPQTAYTGATNGLLTNKIVSYMDEILDMGLPLWISVSINGREETHDKTRGEGSWRKAIETLRALKSLGSIAVSIAYTLTPETIHDYQYMVNLATAERVGLGLSWARTSKRYGGQEIKWTPELVQLAQSIEYLPPYFRCPALKTIMVINPDGLVWPCEVDLPDDMCLGNLYEHSLDWMWTHRRDKIRRFIEDTDCYCMGKGWKDGAPMAFQMDCFRRRPEARI